MRQRGFAPVGWQLGLNRGADGSKLARLEQRLAQLHRDCGQRTIVIGWSLGGLYARVLAHRVPQHIAMVVTVASPFSGDRHANNAWRVYEAINDHTVDAPPFAEDWSAKPPVTTLAVWSGIDGIVAPACARGQPDEADATLRIDAPHFALGTSRRCIERIIAEVAALKERA